jgi:hypothetical protein
MNVETEMNEYVFWHQQIDKYLTVHYIDKWMSLQKYVILILDILHCSNRLQYKPGVQREKKDPDSISQSPLILK